MYGDCYFEIGFGVGIEDVELVVLVVVFDGV